MAERILSVALRSIDDVTYIPDEEAGGDDRLRISVADDVDSDVEESIERKLKHLPDVVFVKRPPTKAPKKSGFGIPLAMLGGGLLLVGGVCLAVILKFPLQAAAGNTTKGAHEAKNKRNARFLVFGDDLFSF